MVGCKDMTEEQLIYETEQLLTPLADRDCKECKGEKKVTAAKASLLVPEYRNLQTQEELAGLVRCPYCRGSGRYIAVKRYTTGEVGVTLSAELTNGFEGGPVTHHPSLRASSEMSDEAIIQQTLFILRLWKSECSQIEKS